ncbi:unnamed protein product [Arctogadus glacialis]
MQDLKTLRPNYMWAAGCGFESVYPASEECPPVSLKAAVGVASAMQLGSQVEFCFRHSVQLRNWFLQDRMEASSRLDHADTNANKRCP